MASFDIYLSGVNISEAIGQRRSIKRFADTPVTREQVERLLAAATQGPNHRLTQPWRFYVLGPDAREAYGRALGERKAKKQVDPARAAEVRESTAAEHRALPLMIAVAVVEVTDAEQREEDYAATMIGIGYLALAALEMGLGTAMKTGGVMQDPAARAAVGVEEGEKIIAVVNVGVPSEVPPVKVRKAVADLVKWRQ